jgi:polyisoprenyl-phosphate glycosyltransferase
MSEPALHCGKQEPDVESNLMRVDASEKNLWIVVPCYFDVPSFRILRTEAQKFLSGQYKKIRFIVVDDSAGRDPEMGSLSEFADVHSFKAPFNLGHQKALVYGLRRLKKMAQPEDDIVTMDSDGEDRPLDLPELLKNLNQNPKNLVLARRTQRSESFKFRAFYQIYKLFFRTLTGRTIQSGNFAAYRAQILGTMIDHPHFDRCYSMSLFSSRIPVTFVPFPRGVRFQGVSRMNTMNLVRHGLNMLMPFLDQIAFRGIMLLSLVAVAGFLCGVAVIYIKLFTVHAIPGWASYLILGIASLSLTAIGNLLILFFMYTQLDSHFLMNSVSEKEE